MKKNYFYTTVGEELSLLLSAVRSRDDDEISALRHSCAARHTALCRRLLTDFITPVEREDLYEISKGILAVFSSLSGLSAAEAGVAEQGVMLLSAAPFRFDASVLRRREEWERLCASVPHPSPAGASCFRALDRLCEILIVTAVKNA